MHTVPNPAVERPPEDIAAEGLWRIAAGKSCQECWQDLPEGQKEWWRYCAMEAVKWIGSHFANSRWQATGPRQVVGPRRSADGDRGEPPAAAGTARCADRRLASEPRRERAERLVEAL